MSNLNFNSSSKTQYKIKNKNIFIINWLKHHYIAFKDSLKALLHAPIANLLTMLVLGIATALPVLLYLIILNLNFNLSSWQQEFYQYSLYLNNNLNNKEINKIQNDISNWAEVKNVKLITKEEGLSELKSSMGLNNILDNIKENPLPNILIISIKPEYQNIKNIKNLVAKSSAILGVSKAETDIAWLEKLSNILNVFSYVVYAFSLVLGFAILLVISNTIRLTLDNKKQEMILNSLLGATRAYIRRPYLYGGLFYGLFAGLIAYIVSDILFDKLLMTITSTNYFNILNLNIIKYNFSDFIFLLFTSSFLGWLGARVSLFFQHKKLNKQLSKI